MATEIYTPPASQQPTKIYTPPTDATGTTTYEDPNKVLFTGYMSFVGYVPTVT